jgi:hypothetical protein
VNAPRRFAGALACAFAAMLLLTTTALAAGAPVIGATAATDVEGISALLTAKANPNGQATTYRFQYGTAACSAGSCASTPEAVLGSGSGDRSATSAISGLIPDTTYHYRLVATNASSPSGGTLGPEQTFTTTHGFGFLPGASGFEATTTKLDGTPATQAGSHPYELSTAINFNRAGEFAEQPGVPFPDGDLKDLRLELPPGLIGNPTVIGQCTLAQFNTPRTSPFENSLSGESCPTSTQVGVVAVHSSFGGGGTRYFGLFNLVPPPGFAAELGFSPFGDPITFGGSVRTAEGEYGLTLEARNFPQGLSIDGVQVTIWGTPWALSHNSQRGNCLNEANAAEPWAKCTVGPPKQFPRHSFLTLPTSCEAPPAFTVSADSWQRPDAFVSAHSLSQGEDGQPTALQGCELLVPDSIPFGQPTTVRASSPTGFEFNLEVPQDNLIEPTGLAGTQIRDAAISLPEGMTINPSVGAGLGVCTPAQYAAETATSAPGAGCPNSSKIGDFRVETPLLEEAVNGSIFLAQPFNNPSNSLIGIYLVSKAAQRGIQVKVAGKLTPDPSTGRLTASFENLPQIPYTHLRAFFREGQRAPLASPSTCGTYPVQMELTPWLDSAAPLQRSSEFPISAGVGGGPCPSGTPPFTPGAQDGSVNSNAGSYAPYYLHLTRNDTEQEITSYSALLPPGLTGKIAGIPYCSDADIAAAKAKTGTEELEDPSCPAASEVGHTVTGYGLGGVLTYAPGKLYLTGPYHGSPLSITAVDSALVGPFDLGVIIVRSALKINPQTAQVSIDSAGSDPIPHILDGIPLHLRDIRVYISRPNFTLNPTSCEPFAASSTLLGAGARISDPSDDVPASATNLYQATNCSALKFAPKLSLKLIGGTRRSAFPELRAVARERPGDANIGRAIVALPHTEFLAQGHIREICSLRQFEAQACPPSSIYGHAAAYSPLLSEPLEGPVYLRSSANHRGLPEMVAALRGAGGIAINIEGRIDSTKAGGLRASFNVLPDAPASKFVLTLEGGKKGLLENSANTCAETAYASAQFVGQNGAGESLAVPMQSECVEHHKHSRLKRSTSGRRIR